VPVPAEFWSEAAQMVTSGLLVAAIALPVALTGRALRPRGEPLLPPWQPWQVPWGGFAVLVAFFVLNAAPLLVNDALVAGDFYRAVYGEGIPPQGSDGDNPEARKEANTVLGLWAHLFALPLSLGGLWLLARVAYGNRSLALAGRGSCAGQVALAIFAWLVVTPVVLAVHGAVNQLFIQFGVPPEEHSLTRLGVRPLLDRVLFVVEACAGAPLTEELFFRGVLLAWCVKRARDAEVATEMRPWLVMAAAGAFAALPVLGGRPVGPVVFAAVLAVGLAVLWRLKRTGARRARAVYATAAFFALVHSGVWPTPIPLFVLGLALGWLAVRTNGILVPVIVHGLFNAVSAVYVLRGG
jgi:membrane protease YdiL (CAAX protease family)